MLRGPKHSKIEVVAPNEEELEDDDERKGEDRRYGARGNRRSRKGVNI